LVRRETVEEVSGREALEEEWEVARQWGEALTEGGSMGAGMKRGVLAELGAVGCLE
jgi:hypothetical protein